MNKIKIVKSKPSVKENTPVSVGLNMDQTDAVYKVLEDNFGEEHMKDMFTLGSLSFYNMMVKGGIAGVFNEGKVKEAIEESDLQNAKNRLKDPHTIEDIEYSKTSSGDKFVKIIYKKKYVPGKMMDTGPHFVSVFYNDENELQNIGRALKLKLEEDNKDGVFNEETINEDKAAAARWFGNLKSFYLKAFRELKGEDQATYKTLIKNWANGLSDNKVGVNEQPDVLNKIADMFDRKYPHLTFEVNTMFDRIEVRGDDQDVFTFGEELAGQKIFDYEITTIDKEGRNYEVRIVRSDSIVRNAVNPTNEEKPGLWANIRAKQERGEKPARKGSKAYKIAKKAGDEINKEK